MDWVRGLETNHDSRKPQSDDYPAAASAGICDRLAARVNTSRSQVISQALAAAETREQERVAAVGYRFYAGEAVEFADASSRLVAEVFARTPTEVTNVKRDQRDGRTILLVMAA